MESVFTTAPRKLIIDRVLPTTADKSRWGERERKRVGRRGGSDIDLKGIIPLRHEMFDLIPKHRNQ